MQEKLRRYEFAFEYINKFVFSGSANIRLALKVMK